MKSLLFRVNLTILLVAGLSIFAQTAVADAITYKTTGAIAGGGNTATFGSGGNTLTITFNGITLGLADTAPAGFTNVSFGQIDIKTLGSGAAISSGTPFSLTISQLSPSAASANLSGTLSGFLTSNASTGLVSFSVQSLTLGGYQYSLEHSSYDLVPPSTSGLTTIQGRISAVAVPEPTTLLLLGTGLIGVATGLRKRRR